MREVMEHSVGEEREPLEVEIHAVRLGDLAIATNPLRSPLGDAG